MQTLEPPELIEPEQLDPKISGFDAAGRSILKEPTLYLSIFGLFTVSSLALLNTPTLFWTVFISLSALSVIFHILAERYIFSSKKENEKFSLPYEGIFVVTFGSLLPGISLLAYSIFSLVHTHQPNYFSEFGKIALLLCVPLLNFGVWRSVKRRYLNRPRLTGMMNGIAIGLSASWTIIWIKTCFFSTVAASCKFGWMFLLCVSPFLLLAAVLLQIDLCRKTEARIARITGTFSVMGAVMSLLFVFTPTVHTLVVQSALHDVKKSAPADLQKTISFVQSIAGQEDLLPSEYPVSGFGLGGMLIPNRGLENGSEQDKDLYFRITGSPSHEVGQQSYDPDTWKPEEVRNVSGLVGSKVAGLSLAKSEINGTMDAHTMSSSIDWSFTFYNASSTNVDPCAEIALPAGAVVSRATLWLNNEPHESALVPNNLKDFTYGSPVLVSQSGKDKIFVRCIQVPQNGGERKMRITFKLPLSTKDGNCSVRLPKIVESNFHQPKRTHIQFHSKDMFNSTRSGVVYVGKDKNSFDEIEKNPNPDEPPNFTVSVGAEHIAKEIAVQDLQTPNKPFILQRLEEVHSYGPQRLVVVVDSSEQMKPYVTELKNAFSKIPAKYSPVFYFAKTQSDNDTISSQNLNLAKTSLDLANFSGGQDNSNVLREALENAAEKSNSAVLWIHGPQPLATNPLNSIPLELVHGVRLYDFAVQAGPNDVIKSLGIGSGQNSCIYKSVDRTASVGRDLCNLVSSWDAVSISTRVSRKLCTHRPDAEQISDRVLSEQVLSLWAKDEITRLTDDGQTEQAKALAARYHVVTPLTEMVVGLSGLKIIDPSVNTTRLAQNVAYVGNTAYATKVPAAPMTVGPLPNVVSYPPQQETYRGMAPQGPGLVGAPVDPRYGQSNEVGQLADYGYDSARDIGRMATALSTVPAFLIFMALMRRRRSKGGSRFGIALDFALAFGIPTAVHLVGTFMINNFGGLGGGL